MWDEIDYQKWICNGCQHCVRASVEICLSDQLAAFVASLRARYSLPLTDETDGLICFNQSVPDMTCDPLTPVMEALQTDETDLRPTTDQRCELLKAGWPSVAYWFGQNFPNFHLPQYLH